MKSYWIRLHQIECSSPSRSSSALIVRRQNSLSGPKTRLFKTTLAGWWYFLLVCPRATARLQLKSTLFPPCHILKREHYWRGRSGSDSLSAIGEETSANIQYVYLCVTAETLACVCASNKASHSWQRLSREDRERKESRSTLPFLFSLLEKMSACISLFSCWHKTQPHTHTPTHTSQGGMGAAKKRRREMSRKERDGGRRKRREEKAIWSSAFTLAFTDWKIASEENCSQEQVLTSFWRSDVSFTSCSHSLQ